MRRFMSRSALFHLGAMFVLLLGGVAPAQQVEVSSSLNPVGSGARATGMGGAFISVADDATAASWNPAGLIHLERPEVSVVYSYFNRSQAYHAEVHREIETTNRMDTSGLNYASVAYPFVFLKRNMIVSLNYQRLYEMTKTVDFKIDYDYILDKTGAKAEFTSVERFVQRGYLYAISPAFAVQVTPKFYAGATVNFWGDYVGRNGWDITHYTDSAGIMGKTTFTHSVIMTNDISFRGTNAHFGFLWAVHGPFTIGGVYKTAFDGRLRQEQGTLETTYYEGRAPFTRYHPSAADVTLKMPASYGIGVSYRHSDAWNVALDVYHTEWSDYILRNSKGEEYNPIDKTSISDGSLKDTTQVRLGTEYLIIKDNYVVPLRGGLFYDPEPTKKGSDDYYGFSLGTGLSKKKFSLDASYQYRFGRKVSSDLPLVEGGINSDNDQHTIMMSLIYYF